MEDRWIDEKEASRITGFTRAAFQAWRWKGGGPPFTKLGQGRRGAVRYLLSDIHNFIKRHPKVTSTSQYTMAAATGEKVKPDQKANPGSPAPVSIEAIRSALGQDFINGWKAREVGRSLNLERSKNWRRGWIECDDGIGALVASKEQLKVRKAR